jgi:AcrR family transcriptional regulator
MKTELSRAAIVDRALAIADTEGRDAITIRRLAQEFGVTPMALYWHVSNKDDLLAAMGDWFFEHVAVPADGDWQSRLSGIVHSLIDALRAHPESAHLAPPRVLQSDAGRNLTEQTLALLRAEGLSVAQAADIARTALQTAVRLVTERAGYEGGVAAGDVQEVLAAKRRAISALPVEQYPNLVEAADAFTECADVDAYYRFGVELFLGGIHELLAAQSRV